MILCVDTVSGQGVKVACQKKINETMSDIFDVEADHVLKDKVLYIKKETKELQKRVKYVRRQSSLHWITAWNFSNHSCL